MLDSTIPLYHYPHISTNLLKTLSKNTLASFQDVCQKAEQWRLTWQWQRRKSKMKFSLPYSQMGGYNIHSLKAMLATGAPIVKAQIYPNGLKIVRERTIEFDKPTGGKRKPVKELSKQSL